MNDFMARGNRDTGRVDVLRSVLTNLNEERRRKESWAGRVGM